MTAGALHALIRRHTADAPPGGVYADTGGEMPLSALYALAGGACQAGCGQDRESYADEQDRESYAPGGGNG